MMDQSLASLVTRERDDYFGRFFTASEWRNSIYFREYQILISAD